MTYHTVKHTRHSDTLHTCIGITPQDFLTRGACVELLCISVEFENIHILPRSKLHQTCWHPTHLCKHFPLRSLTQGACVELLHRCVGCENIHTTPRNTTHQTFSHPTHLHAHPPTRLLTRDPYLEHYIQHAPQFQHPCPAFCFFFWKKKLPHTHFSDCLLNMHLNLDRTPYLAVYLFFYKNKKNTNCLFKWQHIQSATKFWHPYLVLDFWKRGGNVTKCPFQGHYIQHAPQFRHPCLAFWFFFFWKKND